MQLKRGADDVVLNVVDTAVPACQSNVARDLMAGEVPFTWNGGDFGARLQG